jgi:hypothetical protein
MVFLNLRGGLKAVLLFHSKHASRRRTHADAVRSQQSPIKGICRASAPAQAAHRPRRRSKSERNHEMSA